MDRYDLLISNVSIFDGRGEAPVLGDVAISGDRIAEVKSNVSKRANVVIDGRDLALAPGFIDVHTHDDLAVLSAPAMTSKISQGVTTVVVGNCGASAFPLQAISNVPAPLTLLGAASEFLFPTFASYASAVVECRPSVNVASLVGHTTLRASVMNSLDRAASGTEIELMSTLLASSLSDGAIGLSSGLDYPAAALAPTEEVVALCRIVGEYGGIYTSHLRDERDSISEALEEALHIGRCAQVPLLVSHKKCSGHRNWGRSSMTLRCIEEARRLQKVDLDCYPYTASSTILMEKYVDPDEAVLITWCKPYPEMSARYLSDIIAEWGCSLSEAVERLTPAGAIYFDMDEQDVLRILQFDGTMIGSDGIPGDAHPHPRLWGTFPRFLGHYCRERNLMPVEKAIHRMTAKPAEVFGFTDRGSISVGSYADLVLFDPSTITDCSDYLRPCEISEGIVLVVVNGKITWSQGRHTGVRAGKLLKPRGR